MRREKEGGPVPKQQQPSAGSPVNFWMETEACLLAQSTRVECTALATSHALAHCANAVAMSLSSPCHAMRLMASSRVTRLPKKAASVQAAKASKASLLRPRHLIAAAPERTARASSHTACHPRKDPPRVVKARRREAAAAALITRAHRAAVWCHPQKATPTLWRMVARRKRVAPARSLRLPSRTDCQMSMTSRRSQ